MKRFFSSESEKYKQSSRWLGVTLGWLCVLLPVTTAVSAGSEGSVVSGGARFTVITPNLIRMEYAPSGAFIDEPTFFAENRTARDAEAKISRDDDGVTIDTGVIHLVYKNDGKPFSAGNTSAEIRCGDRVSTWKPGMKSTGNLGGTISTLDTLSRSEPLEEGLLSRDGWYVLEDKTVLMDDGWFKKRPADSGTDWYLFGYGNDFKAALKSLTTIGGPVPLPRKYTLGVWFSHWWPYTTEDFKKIIEDYDSHDLPLDVLVMDMDWHITDKSVLPPDKQPKGKELWGGYSWNRNLIPDPPALLGWIHDRGIAVTLNDHPGSGVMMHEERYADFMKAMGADSSTGNALPFDAADRRYMENFYEFTHRVRDKEGVDFWWLDWQAGEFAKGINTLTNLQAMAFYFFQQTTTAEHRGQSMSRWAGWGDHRYPIYFSGDAGTEWATLAFEVPFTSTAGNMGCFYWSHDIGGYGGARHEETYTRWCQFGALSPALRCHSGKRADLDRRPWKWPDWSEKSMRRSFHLRSELMPYVYSTAWQANQQSLPPVRPMYLGYPEEETAYHQGQEYLFGDHLLVAPIVQAGQGPGRVASQVVWFPEGDWYQFFTGEKYSGPFTGIVTADIDEFPLFARGGFPIPMQPYTPRPGTAPLSRLVVRCYPGEDGKNGETTLYEDDGISPGYLKGEYATTGLGYLREGGNVTVRIEAAKGTFKGQLQQRSYLIELYATDAPESASIDGKPVEPRYDPQTRVTSIDVPGTSKDREVVVRVSVSPADASSVLSRERNRRLKELVGKPYDVWGASPEAAKASPELQQAIHAVEGFGVVTKNEHPYLLAPETSLLYCDLPGAKPVTARISCLGKTKELVLQPGRSVSSAEWADFLPVKPARGCPVSAKVAIDRAGRTVTQAVELSLPADESGNLARKAKVEVSSQIRSLKKEGLNDGVAGDDSGSKSSQWITDNKSEGWAKLTWDQPVKAGRILLYDRPDEWNQVLEGELSFSDGTSVPTGKLPNDGLVPLEVTFPAREITWVKFTTKKVTPSTKWVGLNEMAVYEK